MPIFFFGGELFGCPQPFCRNMWDLVLAVPAVGAGLFDTGRALAVSGRKGFARDEEIQVDSPFGAMTKSAQT